MMNNNREQRVRAMAIPVAGGRKTVAERENWTVSNSSFVQVGHMIDGRIRQNDWERIASANAAAKCIVGNVTKVI